jgi:hypothetical protein
MFACSWHAIATSRMVPLRFLKREMSLSDLAYVFLAYAMLDGILNLAGLVTAAESCER